MAEARVERRLAAILAADVAGYSRLMGADELGTLEALKALRRDIVDPAIASQKGRIVKTTGDGMLVEFASVVDAVTCAMAIQDQMAERNSNSVAKINLRVGINVGDVIVDGGDIFGDGVNVAARVESECETGGVCLSDDAFRQVRGKTSFAFDDLGERHLKNIDRPMRIYAARSAAFSATVSAASASRSFKPLALPDKPSIAVLPFENMRGDPGQQYFADGIAEDLITNLSRMRWIFVIARTSSFRFKGQGLSAVQIAQQLGVHYVVEGSIRKSANRMRITVQLTEGTRGTQVWTHRFDRPVEDVFAVQEEIADIITATLEPEIGAAERARARRKPPDSLDSWERYQRGMWHLLRRNRDDLSAARSLFVEAIALDPSFASAHAALAVSCFFQITHGFASDYVAMRDQLIAEASEAVALDPRDHLAHSAMGIAFMECGRREEALSEHRIALELNPSNSFSRWAFGYALLKAGRDEEAVDQFDSALRLSPRDPAAWSYLTLKAASLYQLKRYDEAAVVARDATRFPVADLVWPYVHWAASLGQLNDSAEALPVIDELRRRRPGLTLSGFRSWPHITTWAASLDHIVDGLRKAGLPE
jgi:adenylate cyclase